MVRVAYDQAYGRVKVWNIEQEKYVWMAPIDAREGMVCGMVTPYAPDEEPTHFGDADPGWVNLIPADHLHK